MASNLTAIVSFLEGKGLSKNAIAGIVGNLQVESGFRTDAYNAGEGAIGLGQWEGGRRTALQSYARAHGTSETDLNAQLGFMWQEMNQRGLVQALNTAGSASQAADIWDQKYEVSSGSSRGQREQNANSYASGGTLAGASAEGTSSAGATAYMQDGSAVPTLTAAQKRQALQSGAGDLYSLALAVPELAGLINTAITSGQTASEFQNAVTNSKWYKTHSDSTRQLITLQQSDPATYKKNLTQAESHVMAVANQLGVTPGTELLGIAHRYLAEGWDDNALSQFFDKAHVAWDTKKGSAAQAMAEMTQASHDYGVTVTAQAMNQWAKDIATGVNTIDSFKQRMQQNAATIYPGLASQLASGQTTRQLADPYITTMANTLELDPNTIQWSNDPLIKRALQTPTTTAGGTGAQKGTGTGAGAAVEPGTTPLWQFEQQLRTDPRWQYTSGAKSQTASMLTQLGQDWGYAS